MQLLFCFLKGTQVLINNLGKFETENDNSNIYDRYVVTIKKISIFKMKLGFFGQTFSVATLSILYLTESGIIIQSLKSIGQFNMLNLMKKAIRNVWTDQP